MTWINHGFYNFSLTLFYDVYRYNGFGEVTFFLVAFPHDWQGNPTIGYEKVAFVPHQFRLRVPPESEMIVSCIATKERSLDKFQVPIQAAYDPALRISSPLKQWS